MKRSIFSLPSFRTGIILYKLLSFALLFVPLFNILGYEFSAAFSLAGSLVAGFITIGMYKRKGEQGLFSLLLSAAIVNELLLLIPFVIISIAALFIENCAYAEGLLYFLLYPCNSVLIAVALAGFVLATGVKHKRTWFCALWLLCAAYHAAVAYFNPALFSYWWTVGFFPGFQYDMTMRITRTLLLARAGNLCMAALLLTSAWLMVRTGKKRTVARIVAASQDVVNLGAHSVIFGALLIVNIAAFTFRCELGFERTHEFVTRTLDQHIVTEHFAFFYKQGSLSEHQKQWIADRGEYFYSYFTHYLPQPDSSVIKVFLYPNTSEKKYLLGSRSTSITKPWVREIHMGEDEFDGTFEHELVHVLCAAYGLPAVNASLSIGLEEGTAVALTAMEDGSGERLDKNAVGILHYLPANSFAHVFSPAGFIYGNVDANYAVAGSFVKYLITKFGAARLQRAFTTGDFEGAYHFTLDELRQDWLITMAKDNILPQPEWAVRGRFGTTFLFSTACAHYVANKIEDADVGFTRGDTDLAFGIMQNLIARHANRNVLNTLLDMRYAKQEYDSVEDIFTRYLPNDSSFLRGDAALALGNVAQAKAIYKNLAMLDSDNIPSSLLLRLRVCSDSSLSSDTAIRKTLARRKYADLVCLFEHAPIPQPTLYDLCWLSGANTAAAKGEYDTAEALLAHTNYAIIIEENASMLPFYCHTHALDLLHLNKTKNAAQFIESVRHFIDPDIFDSQFAPLLRFADWKLRNTREV